MQYQDNDMECAQCPFKESCRPEVFRRMAVAPPNPPTVQVPMPQRTFPVVTPGPLARPVVTPVYQPPQPPVPQMPVYSPPQAIYQPTHPGYVLPPGAPPNPMMAWSRPGTNQQYYFCQFPGESTPERLAKNMALRAGESLFQELAAFFRHWTWPPRT